MILRFLCKYKFVFKVGYLQGVGSLWFGIGECKSNIPVIACFLIKIMEHLFFEGVNYD